MPTNKQERERARRNLQQQLERRKAAEARRRKTMIGVTVVATLAVIGVVLGLVVGFSGGDDKPSAAGSPSTSTSAGPGAKQCDYVTGGEAAKPAQAPAPVEPSTGTVDIAVATSQGALTLSLNRALAPCSVESVVSLVEQKYYDATTCHRLVTAGIFVLQCGDPKGDGTGGPGYTVPDEATGSEKYPAGTIAMARTSQANSTGGQFFIVYDDSPNLAQNLGALQYTVVGTITKGLDVVKKVAAAGSDNSNGQGDGKPKLPLNITTMTIASETGSQGSSSSSAATGASSPAASTADGSPAAS